MNSDEILEKLIEYAYTNQKLCITDNDSKEHIGRVDLFIRADDNDYDEPVIGTDGDEYLLRLSDIAVIKVLQ